MFWSSEGFYFMRCAEAEVRAMSQAAALHRAWSGMMARGVAMVSVEDPGMDELQAELDRLRSAPVGATGQSPLLRLGAEGAETLRTVIEEAAEALRSYVKAPASAHSQGPHGLLEDFFGETLRDPKVSKATLSQFEALSQRIGLEAD
ncbi:MAG: hypothetical protein HYY01_08255 [Chloroflexi bacterium]|nr:hypothetical protein [Chloroflexota bacterium]